MPDELQKTYSPQDIEDTIYKRWEESGFFNPDALPDRETPFSIMMPPPNATGVLHTGHSLGLVLQDLMIRYHRMIGDRTLWLPGTDHASIATQNKVEKLLAVEGITRHDLGREEFIKRVTAYVEQSRSTIRNQIRKMGASCDWSRERYTLDEGLSHAVNELFVRMYNDGLIYRGFRIVNWCPRCTSTLADDEVKHRDVQGMLYFIKYPMHDGGDAITIATTRPETMLGDTAVAVNPTDTRWSQFAGRTVRLPLVGREIVVIADPYVDKDFGSGALKVTPSHDLNDFELGKKYHLEFVKILDEHGAITLVDILKEGLDTSQINQFKGMDRFDARERIVTELEAQGLLEKKEEYHHAVAICYRCDTVIEPLISHQWFVAVDKKIQRYNASLKELALDTVASKKTQIVPKRFEKTYNAWITNLKDWCISRQIWFGHQLPVWYCTKQKGGCGETIVSVTPTQACTACKKEVLIRDEDTLDTWFSAGQWTFATLGWPNAIHTDKHGISKKTGDLATFHPTSVLETAYDIIFFWVARMIILTRYALGEQPFDTVYLHGLVLDAEGKKMSKSKEEQSIDPLKFIVSHGTDALRMALLIGTTPGNNLKLGKEKIERNRNLVNKLWNVSRFILTPIQQGEHKKHDHTNIALTLADRWIISRLNRTIADVTADIDQYRFAQAAQRLTDFTWNELADWYIEISKIEQGKHDLLVHLLETLLSLWHPFMPYVTEHIYQHLTPAIIEIESRSRFHIKRELKSTLLMIHPWPSVDTKHIDTKSEAAFSVLMAIVQAIRNARAENTIAPAQKIQAVFFTPLTNFIESNITIIKYLARLDIVTILSEGDRPTNAIYIKEGDIDIYLPLGLLKREEERERLEKDIASLNPAIERLEQQLSNKDFLVRAPEHIVKHEQVKLEEYKTKRGKIEEQLRTFA
ncbi:MAG: valine--tRNA ligase [Patescibacteria group bacterium]